MKKVVSEARVNGSSNYERSRSCKSRLFAGTSVPSLKANQNERLQYLSLPSKMVKMRTGRNISRKDLNGRQLGFFLSGFVEGEGSFNVSLRRKTDYKVGWQVVLSFNVSQKDPTILRVLRDELRCGIIKVRKKDNLYSFDVTNPRDLILKVIPYFQRYPVLSDSKKRNFAIFCQVVRLMVRGGHRTPVGLRKIVELRERINVGAGRTRKYGIGDVFHQESPETIRRLPPLAGMI